LRKRRASSGPTDHEARHAGLGVDHQPLEVDRRHQIVIGAPGRVRGPVQLDGVDEQEGDAERDQQGSGSDHERNPRGQPQDSLHSTNLRTVEVVHVRAALAS
jgi:hypothetical protein